MSFVYEDFLKAAKYGDKEFFIRYSLREDKTFKLRYSMPIFFFALKHSKDFGEFYLKLCKKNIELCDFSIKFIFFFCARLSYQEMFFAINDLKEDLKEFEYEGDSEYNVIYPYEDETDVSKLMYLSRLAQQRSLFGKFEINIQTMFELINKIYPDKELVYNEYKIDISAPEDPDDELMYRNFALREKISKKYMYKLYFNNKVFPGNEDLFMDYNDGKTRCINKENFIEHYNDYKYISYENKSEDDHQNIMSAHGSFCRAHIATSICLSGNYDFFMKYINNGNIICYESMVCGNETRAFECIINSGNRRLLLYAIFDDYIKKGRIDENYFDLYGKIENNSCADIANRTYRYCDFKIIEERDEWLYTQFEKIAKARKSWFFLEYLIMFGNKAYYPIVEREFKENAHIYRSMDRYQNACKGSSSKLNPGTCIDINKNEFYLKLLKKYDLYDYRLNQPDGDIFAEDLSGNFHIEFDNDPDYDYRRNFKF